MRHRSDDRCAFAFYGPLLHRGDVVSDLRRRNDFSAAVGHYLHGRGLLVYEVCANRDVCIHRDSGGRLLLRMAEAGIGMGLNFRDEGGGMRDESVGRQDLRKRTKDFAIRIIKLYAALPKTTEGQVIGKQILRSGTSVGAHYREACRAKSNADFISKIEGGLQELDETLYWLELLTAAEIVPAGRLQPLESETNELIAMFVSMVRN